MPLKKLKGDIVVAGIGKISYNSQDIEHYMIIQQLKALGITPSGNKALDRAKLSAEKSKLIQKILAKSNKKEEEKASFKNILVQTNEENNTKSQLELEMLGAKTVGELNRIYFSI